MNAPQMTVYARALAAALLVLALASPARAQQTYTLSADSSLPAALPTVRAAAPLPMVEDDLRGLMRVLMRHPDFALRLQAHQALEAALLQVLQRPESYAYRFDSLQSLVRLAPQDESFRIFTWMLVDPSGNHSYGGIVQRRLPIPNQKDAYDYLAIALRDRVDMVAQIETTPLDHDNWLGALYYHPRNSPYGVLSYPGEFYRVSAATGKTRKEKVTYYALLGLNNHDARSNYKIIEFIHFDPRDPRKVLFGVPVLYVAPSSPRMRAVFKYADNATFTLNVALVMQGKKKVPMIVFDHLAEPKKTDPNTLWSYGSDGSTDAYYFYPGYHEMRKGAFFLRPNVVVYDPTMDKYDPDQVRTKSEAELAKLRRSGMEYQSKRKQQP